MRGGGRFSFFFFRGYSCLTGGPRVICGFAAYELACDSGLLPRAEFFQRRSRMKMEHVVFPFGAFTFKGPLCENPDNLFSDST